MGFFDKIKNWFRRLTTGEEQVAEVKLDQPVKSEVDILMEEHTALTDEREQIRRKLEEIDEKFNMGELEAAEHDREYRQQLARAGQIRLRQMEISAKLAELGSPLPD
jgi:regulator of replication initiation timing